jgi:hypothetical protein
LAPDVRVCLAVAAGCLLLGSIGWLAHLVLPAAAKLTAIAWIGGFYLALGLMGMVRQRREKAAVVRFEQTETSPARPDRRVA